MSEAGIRLIFRALKSRNYRLFFGGQSVSLVGTWMQQVAMGWLVYRMTDSALLLGVVGFAGQIPTFFLSPLAGLAADRFNKHRLIIVTQFLAMAQALVLAVLVLTGMVAIWHVIVLSVFLGMVSAFDIPVRQSFIVEMLDDREDLGNAIALSSMTVNLARLIGPSMAGVLIGMAGEGICFLLNGVSYLAVIYSLMAMKLAPRKAACNDASLWQGLAGGFRYAFGFMPIRSIIGLLATVSLMGVSAQILMPVFARDIFHGGPETLGFLMAMSGIGALIGAVYLASRKSVIGLDKVLAATVGIFGLGLMALSFSRSLPLSMALVLVTGFGMMVQMTSSNTVLQTIVEEDMRGRVMSLYTVAFIGMAPFGSLLAGGLASRIGAPHTVLIAGAVCLAGALVFAKNISQYREKMHPIFVEKGIIPEVASGLQTAERLELLSKE